MKEQLEENRIAINNNKGVNFPLIFLLDRQIEEGINEVSITIKKVCLLCIYIIYIEYILSVRQMVERKFLFTFFIFNYASCRNRDNHYPVAFCFFARVCVG